MAFLVEDGTGLPNSNSYVSVADANTYFTDRAMAGFPSDLTAAQAALIQATDYIDRRFGGAFVWDQLQPGVQALEWPRYQSTSGTGWDWPYGPQPIDPTPPTSSPLPPQLVKACCEYAFRAAKAALAPDPEVDPSGYEVTQKMTKVGPIETLTRYATAGPGSMRQLLTPYPIADMLLRSLLISGGVTRVIRN